MGLIRDLRTALSEGLADLLQSQSPADEAEEVTSLLESDINETRTELNLARADEKRLRGRIEQERHDAEQFHQQAQEAVNRGDEDSARDLLRRQRRSLRGADILTAQLDEQREVIELLAAHAEELDDKLQEVRLRRDYLRSRQKVRSLKERYERYRRDFGLDATPLADVAAPARRPDEGEISAEELLAERPDRRPRRHVTADEPARDERGTQPLTGLGEVPRPRRTDEPGLRTSDDEPEPEEARWERPPRDLRALREGLLARIEAQHARDAAFEAELDDALAALKAGAAAQRPASDGEVTRKPELPPTPTVEVGTAEATPEPAADGEPPTLQPEPPAPEPNPEATDGSAGESGPAA